MKKISIWASRNKWKSRILIIAIYILLNIVGWLLGNLIPQFNDTLAYAMMWIFSVLTFYILIIYSSFKRNYFKRKMCDLVLITCTFGYIIVICNNGNVIPRNNAYSASIEGRDTNSLKNHPLYVNFKTKLEGLDKSKLTKREKRRVVKTQIKAVMHEKGMSGSDKVALIIMCIVLGIVLLFGVVALSCTIACSAGEGLGILVALLGTIGVIFFISWLIRQVPNPQKKPPQPKVDS